MRFLPLLMLLEVEFPRGYLHFSKEIESEAYYFLAMRMQLLSTEKDVTPVVLPVIFLSFVLSRACATACVSLTWLARMLSISPSITTR